MFVEQVAKCRGIRKQRPACLVRPRIFTLAVYVIKVNHVLISLLRQDYFSSLLG
jgi:hypothetical protein